MWTGRFPTNAWIAPPGLFRFLLALAVVVSHLSKLDIGRMAVLLFFFLSGYWVSKIWITKFDGHNVRRFYASRYLRVVPLYLILMAVAALARGLPIQPVNLALFGVASADNDPVGISWSLDVELQFYMILPLVFFIAAHVSSAVTGLITLACAVLGWALETSVGFVSVAQYLPPFILGLMTQRLAWTPGPRTAAASLAGFILFTAVAALAPSTATFLDKTTPDPFDRDIFAFFWMAPLIPYVARSLTLRSGPLDRHLGNLSFPVYLVHYPVVSVLAEHFGLGGTTKVLAVLISLVIAGLVYVFIDRPIDAWRVRRTEQVASRRAVAA